MRLGKLLCAAAVALLPYHGDAGSDRPSLSSTPIYAPRIPISPSSGPTWTPTGTTSPTPTSSPAPVVTAPTPTISSTAPTSAPTALHSIDIELAVGSDSCSGSDKADVRRAVKDVLTGWLGSGSSSLMSATSDCTPYASRPAAAAARATYYEVSMEVSVDYTDSDASEYTGLLGLAYTLQEDPGDIFNSYYGWDPNIEVEVKFVEDSNPGASINSDSNEDEEDYGIVATVLIVVIVVCGVVAVGAAVALLCCCCKVASTAANSVSGAMRPMPQPVAQKPPHQHMVNLAQQQPLSHHPGLPPQGSHRPSLMVVQPGQPAQPVAMVRPSYPSGMPHAPGGPPVAGAYQQPQQALPVQSQFVSPSAPPQYAHAVGATSASEAPPPSYYTQASPAHGPVA